MININKNDAQYFHEAISPIGVIIDKDKLFSDVSKLKKLIPDISWPIENNYILTNTYCRSEKGLRETYQKLPYPTYNADDYQGYKHGAIDIPVFPFDYFNDKSNIIYNPFPFEVTVRIGLDDYPERDGVPEDYGKYGNFIDLIVPIKIPGINDMTDSLYFKIRYAHLSNIFVKDNTVVKPGQKIAKIGFTGYTSFMGQHVHIEFILFGRKIDPFEYEIFKDVNNLISYIPGNKNRYPDNYKYPEVQSSFKSFVSLSKNRYGNTIKTKPGKYTFYLMSEKQIIDILMYTNPWGKIKPINWSNKLSYWVKKFYNKLIGKSGIYLSEVANIKEIKKEYVYFKSSDGYITHIPHEDYKKIKKTYYLYEIEVESPKPTSNKGYGLYTYYPVTSDGEYGYQFNIVLEEEKNE